MNASLIDWRCAFDIFSRGQLEVQLLRKVPCEPSCRLMPDRSFDLAATIREMHYQFCSVRALFLARDIVRDSGFIFDSGPRVAVSESHRDMSVSVRVHGHAIWASTEGHSERKCRAGMAFARSPTASTPLCRGTVALLIAKAEKTMEAKPEWSASQDKVQEMKMLYLHAFHPAVVVPLNIRINFRYSCADEPLFLPDPFLTLLIGSFEHTFLDFSEPWSRQYL